MRKQAINYVKYYLGSLSDILHPITHFVRNVYLLYVIEQQLSLSLNFIYVEYTIDDRIFTEKNIKQ